MHLVPQVAVREILPAQGFNGTDFRRHDLIALAIEMPRDVVYLDRQHLAWAECGTTTHADFRLIVDGNSLQSFPRVQLLLFSPRSEIRLDEGFEALGDVQRD